MMSWQFFILVACFECSEGDLQVVVSRVLSFNTFIAIGIKTDSEAWKKLLQIKITIPFHMAARIFLSNS
jgi:hypothetical protein